MSDLQQEAFLDYTIVRPYEAGMPLEIRPGMYVIGDGGAIAYASHESGRRRVAFYVRWMEAVILTPSFLAGSTAGYLELYAKEASEIWFIPYDDWRNLEQMHQDIRNYTSDLMSSQMSSLLFGIYAQTEKNISKRAALILYRIYEKSRQSTGDTVMISHEELAELTGTTREAVTRNVNVLKDAGLVQTGRGKIRILDAQGLQEYANTRSGNGAEEAV
ncbi:MAG: Crp/Fnr family transcriptional regulator [Lachnospiraceae bacterium]|nr:Crp/Fnr family transcriptional regulator [Lachnospiraceae bacterium]